ncbi:NERD domain-containing protein [Bifidobacterium reuteri]|uniref:NERD domain-containing protein n=1 Tax=Bifidobacterium reuteri TaxID=983706 RepID=A0A5J5E6N0_9BIFI|nr:nuclease-related domain-containing protein [Bifidobacterium reuteri]KAA8824845.1 NERD domain-containing protein [Bifidobacterium reuteri]
MGLFDFLSGETKSQSPFTHTQRPFSPYSSSPYDASPFNPTPHSPTSAGAGTKYIKRATEEEIRAAWPTAISRYELQTIQGNSRVPQIDDSLVPRITAEQKKKFHSIKSLPIHGRRIYGKPGSGLGESGFGHKQVASGAAGEQIFAKLLSRDGILDRCVSFWSLSRPTQEGQRDDGGADIDCVLLIDNHLLLIDVKNYRAGLAYHTLIPDKAMFCVYPAARVVAHDPYIFSVNMNWARDNLNKYLLPRCPDLQIDTFVVLVPGESGEATLDRDITWPGGIPAYSYSAFLDIVNRMLPTNRGFVPRTSLEGFLASMTKFYTCPAIDAQAPVNESAWPRPTFDADRDIDELNNGKKTSSSRGKQDKSNKGQRTDDDSSDGQRSPHSRNTSSNKRDTGSSTPRSTQSSSSSRAKSSADTESPRTSRSDSSAFPQPHTTGSSGPTPKRSSANRSNTAPSSLPKGWGNDDTDDDDDWVPPSKTSHAAASRTSHTSQTTKSASRPVSSQWDPFARPDGTPSQPTPISNSTRTARTTTTPRHAAQSTKSSPKVSNSQYMLTQVPQVNASELSYDCGLDPEGKPVRLAFQGISGVTAAGMPGNGEITHMLFATVLMAKRADVFVRFIDCKNTAYLDSYKPAFKEFTARSQGFDAILHEVQAVRKLVDSRLFLIRRLQPNGDYWSMPASKRLKPVMLFVHECGSLFNPDPNDGYVSEEDLEAIESIKLLLQQIIESGRQAGIIVLLSGQQPSQYSLPKALTDACQMRICFGAVDSASVTAILGDRFSTRDNPTAALERSHAIISLPDKAYPDVRFYSAAKPVLEQLLNTGM